MIRRSELTNEAIGKRVICGIYDVQTGKHYGKIVDISDDVIKVEWDYPKRIIEYPITFDDIYFDYQPGEIGN